MTFFSLIAKGGLMMYPIIISSIIAVAIGIYKYRYYSANNLDVEKFVKVLTVYLLEAKYEEAKEFCKSGSDIVMETIGEGLAHVELGLNQKELISAIANEKASQINKYLNYVSTVVTMAPLLGLLGTVTGMIQSFSVLDVANSEPMAVTGGVAEALIATATGLLVAILALIIYTILKQRANCLIAKLEYACNIYLSIIGGAKLNDNQK